MEVINIGTQVINLELLDDETYKNLRLLDKYLLLKNISKCSSTARKHLLDLMLNDFESLVSVIYLSGVKISLDNDERFGIGLNMATMRFRFPNDIAEELIARFTEKFFSFNDDEKQKIKKQNLNLLVENLDYILEHSSSLSDTNSFFEIIFNEDNIGLKTKEKLYSFILNSKHYMSFDWKNVVSKHPEFLKFPKIFLFVSGNDLRQMFSLFEDSFLGRKFSKEKWLEWHEQKLRVLIESLKFALLNGDASYRKDIVNKIYFAKNDELTFLFEELEKRLFVGELSKEKILEENLYQDDITKAKLGAYLASENFELIPLVEILVEYLKFLRTKYNLELDISVTTSQNIEKVLGFYQDASRTLFINPSYIELTQIGVLRVIDTIHHEIVHAIQYQHDFYEKADYHTLIQIIDACLGEECYHFNYQHISFENDANARGYTETNRFVAENCPQLLDRLHPWPIGNLEILRERIRVVQEELNPSSFIKEGCSMEEFAQLFLNAKNNRKKHAMPALFTFLEFTWAEQIELLDKYPLLRKVFYYSETSKKIELYDEAYFIERLALLKNQMIWKKLNFMKIFC